MSLSSQILALKQTITNAYNAIQTKTGTMPEHKNTTSLANAILSIPQGASGGEYNIAQTNINNQVGRYAITSVNTPQSPLDITKCLFGVSYNNNTIHLQNVYDSVVVDEPFEPVVCQENVDLNNVTDEVSFVDD